MRTKWIMTMAATALVSGSVGAQTLGVAEVSPQQSGISVLTGGVGSADRAMIESQEHNFSTKLVFSGQGGAFLSTVNVAVKDKAGATVVSTLTDGPILLAALPAGSYTVLATASGIEKTQTIAVDKSLKTYQIVFPIKDDPELTGENGTYLPKAASTMDYYAPAAPAAGHLGE